MKLIKVENHGFYSETTEGTWNELVEEMAIKIDNWNTYVINSYEERDGVREYTGELLDEEGNVTYTFYAWMTKEKGEAEVTPYNPA